MGTRDPQDSWQRHFAEDPQGGILLDDPRVVEVVTREAEAAVAELAAWGSPFARTAEGTLD